MTQVGLIVFGGVALFAGDATRSLALLAANVPLEIAGVLIFLVRCGPSIFGPSWWRSREIWLGLSAVSLALDLGLFLHVVWEVVRRRYLYVELVPRWLIFAVDHTTFLAIATTALFGALASSEPGPDVLRRFDVTAAVGLSIGLLGAVIALAADQLQLERFFVWWMALAIVVAVGCALVRVTGRVTARASVASSGR
jgi:hypothetical protein